MLICCGTEEKQLKREQKYFSEEKFSSYENISKFVMQSAERFDFIARVMSDIDICRMDETNFPDIFRFFWNFYLTVSFAAGDKNVYDDCGF